VCIALVTLQSAFAIIPPGSLRLFNMVLGPMVFGILFLLVHAYASPSSRPAKDEAYNSTVIAVMFASLFGVVILALSFFFGAGVNAMAASPMVAVHNLWNYGSVIILGVYVRYKLIKASDNDNRASVVVALTLALAFAQMPGVRTIVNGGPISAAFFFSAFFTPVVLSGVASYFAVRGTLLSVMLISFVFNMTPYLSPILPNISTIIFALITCGIAFLAALAYDLTRTGRIRALRKKEKRAARYAKRPVMFNLITAAVILVTVAFFAGMFPVYPVVVLTGSMEPTFARGSVAFMQRVSTEEVFDLVGEGEVIHFTARTGIDYIHRVVDFRLDAQGAREYITRGDAATVIDPRPVAQEDIMGIARATMPFLGYPRILINSIFGW